MIRSTAILSAALSTLILSQFFWEPPSVNADSSNINVEPKGLHIRESFRGASVMISADVPKGVGAVVEVKGNDQNQSLLRQGRRGGLWMSVGEVEVLGAPSVYLLMSTPDLTSNADMGDQFGYDALKARVQFQGSIPKEGAGHLFGQLVKLKESEGLYGIFPGSLKIVSDSKGLSKIQGELALPSDIAPGVYRISLSILNSGKSEEISFVDFPVEMRGLPSVLASLAHEHATLYGLLAVFIAIVTGFAMGFVFKGKGAH